MLKHCLLLKDGKCRGLQATYCKKYSYCNFYKDKRNMTAAEIEEYEKTVLSPARYCGYGFVGEEKGSINE